MKNKVLFIEARRKFTEFSELDKINESILPEKIHIVYTIQYKNLAEKLKEKLQENHKILGLTQILGCSKINLKAKPLFVGSGTFHLLPLISQKEIFVYEQGKIKKIQENYFEDLEKKEKGKISKFLISENIGLLFSKKPGQTQLENSEKFMEKLKTKYKDKNFYAFVFDNLDITELENFSIDFWINFSCPGLELDSEKIINYEKILNLKI